MSKSIRAIEIWTVTIGSMEYKTDEYVYHVAATSASQAEKKGLRLAKLDRVEKPYCRKVEFEFNVVCD